LIANTIARKKLYEMNRVISDTAEYGCYLFDHACKPLLNNFFKKIHKNQIHVINAPSPAATSALSIADYIIKNYIK